MALSPIIQIFLMNNKSREKIFITFVLPGIVALIYHIIGAIKPFDATPAWRHGLFIGISIICIYGLLKRPDWFVWFFGILTVQQLYSHGSHFVRLLEENKFNWIDFCVLVLTPLVFIFLLMDKKIKS
jgi:hypothetical protein